MGISWLFSSCNIIMCTLSLVDKLSKKQPVDILAAKVSHTIFLLLSKPLSKITLASLEGILRACSGI